jgi:hypothetical protein
MSPFSGLVEVFEHKGLLKKDGNSLRYDSADGTSIKQFRKAWERNDNETLEKIMLELANGTANIAVTDINVTEEDDYAE